MLDALLKYSSSDSTQMVAHEESGSRKTTVVGLFGGHGGTSWDDGIYNGIREITLVYGNCIDSICVEYDEDGKPFPAEKHGGNGNSNRSNHSTANIKLSYPEEYLVDVSGHYCPFYDWTVIRSMTFKTNQRTFGPYGVEEGTPITFSLMEGDRIVGFMGRSGWHLDAIGFRLSRVQTTTTTTTTTASICHKVYQLLLKLCDHSQKND